jgi:hypothetical protein
VPLHVCRTKAPFGSGGGVSMMMMMMVMMMIKQQREQTCPANAAPVHYRAHPFVVSQCSLAAPKLNGR